MKIKITQPWIYRGRVLQPGETLELPDDEGRAAAARGVVRPVIGKARSARVKKGGK